MKKIILLALMSVVLFAAAAFGVDVAPIAPVATVGFLDWFKLHSTEVFALALVLSEFLALIPGFAGNGILDTITKGLKVLTGKPLTPPIA